MSSQDFNLDLSFFPFWLYAAFDMNHVALLVPFTAGLHLNCISCFFNFNMPCNSFCLFVWSCGHFHSSILPTLHLITSFTESVSLHSFCFSFISSSLQVTEILLCVFGGDQVLFCLLACSFWFFLKYANLRACLNLPYFILSNAFSAFSTLPVFL